MLVHTLQQPLFFQGHSLLSPSLYVINHCLYFILICAFWECSVKMLLVLIGNGYITHIYSVHVGQMHAYKCPKQHTVSHLAHYSCHNIIWTVVNVLKTIMFPKYMLRNSKNHYHLFNLSRMGYWWINHCIPSGKESSRVGFMQPSSIWEQGVTINTRLISSVKQWVLMLTSISHSWQ